MTMIDITNVVNISVIVPPAGLAPYSVNNLVCFTKDSPNVVQSASFSAYTSASAVGTDWGTSSATYLAAVAAFAQSPNILTGGGMFIVIPLLASEVLHQAITRATALLYFGGCSNAYALGISGATGYTGATAANLEALQAASVAQASSKLLFLSAANEADLTSGLAYAVKTASEDHARVVYHSATGQADGFRWGYASRGMSTNFSGSNTAQTMNLKTIAGVTVDDGISQTILTEAKAAGCDIYPNIAGAPCVMSFGANGFFDDVYNLQWLVGALEVAGFNYLRGSGTKIPQTEAGMDGLKSAYRAVCGQAVKNGFIAPGSWTGADTFGSPEDFRRNISDFGYYIYNAPVALQAVADRALRAAPVIQIAFKFSGAIHSSSVIVSVNK